MSKLIIPEVFDSNTQQLAIESAQNEGNSWYAIRVRSNLENSAFVKLQSKGYEVFLPLYRKRRRWADRVKDVATALFPGYLFCRFDPRDRLLPILTTPGIVAIVGSGRTPMPVEDKEIAAIQSVLKSGFAVQPWPFLGVGSEVYIETGPLAGVEGVIARNDKTYRLVVSVNLLGRSVAVEIDQSWVRPIPRRTDRQAVAVAEQKRRISGAG